MSSIRTKLALLFVVSCASLSACGDNDDVSMIPVEPGELCPEGGFQIVVNGEVRTVCTAETPSKIEQVAKGEEGNPCITDAVRVTTRVSGEEVVSWICEAASEETLSDTGRYILLWMRSMVDAQLATAASELTCPRFDEESEALVPPSEEDLEQFESIKAMMAYIHSQIDTCLMDHFQAMPSLTEAQRTLLDCNFINVQSICIAEHVSAEPGEACGEDAFEDAMACVEERSDALEARCENAEYTTADELAVSNVVQRLSMGANACAINF